MSTYKIIISDNGDDYRYYYLAKYLDLLLKQYNWIESNDDADCTFVIGEACAGDNSQKNEFRIIFLSDILKHYNDIAFNRGRYLIVRDVDINVTLPSRSCVRYIFYPVPYKGKLSELTRSYGNILVSCNESIITGSVSTKLLHVLNKLSHATINIDSRLYCLNECINENIKFVYSKDKLEEFVEKSDIVIGGGIAIVEAMRQGKNFVIVGEYGYGGIPDSRSIMRFHETFFSGTIGGSMFDPVPPSLVMEDLYSIINNEIFFDFDENVNKLSMTSMNSINIAISSMTKNEVLTFNDDFTIISKEDEYLLLNRYNRKEIMRVDVDTAYCITNDNLSDLQKHILDEFKRRSILIYK